jgi:hypothetical protein
MDEDEEKALREALDLVARNKTSAYWAAEILRRIVLCGCGDHSCRFNPSKGVGTNGGCRCWANVEDALHMAVIAGKLSVTPHATLEER